MGLETMIPSLSKADKDKNLLATVIGGTFSLTLGNLVSQGINYGIYIGLGRFFSPAVYGYFGIIASTFALLQVILRWGLPRSVSYYVAQDKDSARDVLKKSLGLQTVCSLTCFLLFFWFADRLAIALGDPGLSTYLQFCSFFILTFAFVPVYSGLLNGLGAFSNLAGIVVIRHLAKLFLVMGFLAVGTGIYGVIAAYTLSPLVAIACAVWVVRPYLSAAKKQIEVKNIINFGFPLFISGLAVSLLLRIDLFMVQSFLGDPVLTGLYTSASTLIRGPYFLSIGAGMVLFRVVAHLRAKNPSVVREFISRCTRYYLLGLAPVPFILYATGEEILRITFGEAYLLAVPPFRILTLCFLFMVLFSVVTNFIAALDRPRLSMALSLLLLPVQVFLIYAWISTKGLIGVATATTLTWALGAFLGVSYLLRGGYLMLPKWRTLLNVGVASLCTYYLALWASPSGLWLLVFYPLVYSFYLALLGLTGEIGNGEIRALLDALSLSKSHAQKA
jgi:O-antigen/teichoic acid export membrane protein